MASPDNEILQFLDLEAVVDDGDEEMSADGQEELGS